MTMRSNDQSTEYTQTLEDAGVLEWLFPASASAKILDAFVTYKDFDYSETDIAESSGVSIKTALQVIPKLESVELITFTRRVGRAKMYKLNQYSNAAKALQKFVFDIATKRIEDTLGNEQTLQAKIIHEKTENVIENSQ